MNTCERATRHASPPSSENRAQWQRQASESAGDSRGRIKGIDAARGIAMILVCLSHVRVHFADTAPNLYFALTLVTRIATPTFLLLSGFVAAFVLADSRGRMRMTILDRGLFVLIAGHLLLNLNELGELTAAHWLASRVTVTDAIGICLMLAGVMSRLSALSLAAIGISLALASWTIANTLSVESPGLAQASAALFALRTDNRALIDAAIVPYLGVFLVGMALSKSLVVHLRAQRFDRVGRRLIAAGFVALGVTIAAALVWMWFRRSVPDAPFTDFIGRTLDPRSKLPPSPAYLLFYGGCGLLLAASCLLAQVRKVLPSVIERVATIGRASLMCFVAQDWMLKLIPQLFGFDHLESIVFWMVYLLLAVIAMYGLARQWGAHNGNRFLTLGIEGLRRGNAAPRLHFHK